MDANPDEKQDSSLVEWIVTRPSCGLGENEAPEGGGDGQTVSMSTRQTSTIPTACEEDRLWDQVP